jgi:hypothetical protein
MFFKRAWARLLKSHDDVVGINWAWQSIGSISIKSPFGGGVMTEGSNPTDRGKLGTKRHILTDKKGIPLSVAVSSASSHDIKLVTDVVDNTVIRRPESSLISALTHKIRRRQHSICVLTKRTILHKKNRNYSNEGMCYIYRTRKRKEKRIIKKKK